MCYLFFYSMILDIYNSFNRFYYLFYFFREYISISYKSSLGWFVIKRNIFSKNNKKINNKLLVNMGINKSTMFLPCILWFKPFTSPIWMLRLHVFISIHKRIYHYSDHTNSIFNSISSTSFNSFSALWNLLYTFTIQFRISILGNQYFF